MQLFVMLLMMGLLAHDAAVDSIVPMRSTTLMLLAVLGPYLAIVLATWAMCRRTLGVMNREPSRSYKMIRRLDLFNALARLMILGLFLADLYLLGFLVWLRDVIGHWILIPDLIVLALPLGTVTSMWWLYYPIDRRLREASLMRQIDAGQTVWPIWSRGQFILSQIRHQLLLLLAPMLVLLGWIQCVDRLTIAYPALASYHVAMVLAGGMAAFALAPLMIRFVWDTVPLTTGPLRQRLLHLCSAHGVRIRQLLLWRTYGGMVNGAVMGLSRHVRYILLTDGLLERMTDQQIEAVMAHELGHVRRHHMPWMIICALATIAVIAESLDTLSRGLIFVGWLPEQAPPAPWDMIASGLMVGVLVGLWALAFGYISRRFERQADTFAVQHFSEDGVVTSEAVHIVTDALTHVATLNHMTPTQKSWRHGSIAWRVQYLRSLIDKPVSRCDIDKKVRRIRWTCAALGVLMIGLEYFRTM